MGREQERVSGTALPNASTSRVQKSLYSKLCRGHEADKIPNGSFRLNDARHFAPAGEPIGEGITQRSHSLLQSCARRNERAVAHERLSGDADEACASAGNRENRSGNRIMGIVRSRSLAAELA